MNEYLCFGYSDILTESNQQDADDADPMSEKNLEIDVVDMAITNIFS